MVWVYGNATIEPGGMELEDRSYAVDWPKCGKEAERRYWEAVEGGSINSYYEVSCSCCDLYETDYSEP